MTLLLNAKSSNRIIVLNDPVNFVDPLGLLTSSYYNAHGYSNYDIDYGITGNLFPQRYNPNHNMLKPLEPDYVTSSGVILTEEFVADWYSSDEGFCPSDSSDINWTTSLLGGGAYFAWDTPLPKWGRDYTFDFGFVKNLGITYNPYKGIVGFGLGVNFSLPFVNVSVPVGDNIIGHVAPFK